MGITKRMVVRKIRKLGYKILINNLDFRAKDSVLWWDYDYTNPILLVENEKYRITLVAVGDIRIYGKNEENYFEYNGNWRGELTYYLRKTGRWENGNWFEVEIFDKENKEYYEPIIEFDLEEIVNILLKNIELLK